MNSFLLVSLLFTVIIAASLYMYINKKMNTIDTRIQSVIKFIQDIKNNEHTETNTTETHVLNNDYASDNECDISDNECDTSDDDDDDDNSQNITQYELKDMQEQLQDLVLNSADIKDTMEYNVMQVPQLKALIKTLEIDVNVNKMKKKDLIDTLDEYYKLQCNQ